MLKLRPFAALVASNKPRVPRVPCHIVMDQGLDVRLLCNTEKWQDVASICLLHGIVMTHDATSRFAQSLLTSSACEAAEAMSKGKRFFSALVDSAVCGCRLCEPSKVYRMLCHMAGAMFYEFCVTYTRRCHHMPLSHAKHVQFHADTGL